MQCEDDAGCRLSSKSQTFRQTLAGASASAPRCGEPPRARTAAASPAVPRAAGARGGGSRSGPGVQGLHRPPAMARLPPGTSAPRRRRKVPFPAPPRAAASFPPAPAPPALGAAGGRPRAGRGGHAPRPVAPRRPRGRRRAARPPGGSRRGPSHAVGARRGRSQGRGGAAEAVVRPPGSRLGSCGALQPRSGTPGGGAPPPMRGAARVPASRPRSTESASARGGRTGPDRTAR